MFVGGPAIGLKVAMNIGKLESVFLVMFVISQLALNPAFVTQYINRLGDRAIGYLLGGNLGLKNFHLAQIFLYLVQKIYT